MGVLSYCNATCALSPVVTTARRRKSSSIVTCLHHNTNIFAPEIFSNLGRLLRFIQREIDLYSPSLSLSQSFAPFECQYAAVLKQLQEANVQVSSALCQLRQRNSYNRNLSLPWTRPTTNIGDSGANLSSFNSFLRGYKGVGGIS
ncbi:hypothetical protein POM88_004803 [Heracleum sosnowskyi]|uniref:Uncharacterized protein n=1 Tax=Heracleum sosnowskyi TaxID=360622 RepID=A0AAD8NEQ7_9APIA|nr:hypothetical protein POM88_004803 [Heracleum sosnowskyi]